MKKNMFIFLFAILAGAFVFLLSCNKENSNSLPGASLIASKTDAAVGEGIDLSIVDQPPGSSADWLSSSSANSEITSNGFNAEIARVVFSAPGTYTITAYLRRCHHGCDTTHNHHGCDTTHNHHGCDTMHSHHACDTMHSHHDCDTTHHHHDCDTTHHHHDGDTTHTGGDSSNYNGDESDIIEKLSITITIHN